MGSSNSVPKMDPMMEHHQPYPDMNVIFKGIPKMMQVADDMHRMTNYIMDLRNMTVGLVCLSVIGVFLFLILKFAQGRNSAARRKREIGRRNEVFEHLDLDDRSLTRHQASHYGTYQGFADPWHEAHAKLQSTTAIDMDKVQLAVNPMSSDGERSVEGSPRLNNPRILPNLPNGHTLKV
ncbi:unnamed protein product [Anisakis simplex]|uniref:Uncharacterized protein n=1 Tax=Anisakis simplex TaxID=6269 RepID=A0A0M3JZ24_ANISI|nr:unnamed protein product [Anisakis simplex]